MQTTTHSSLWHHTNGNAHRSTETALPAEADVVVIGAGITGLTSAALLARAGKRVVVVEMGDSIGAGDTGQTTAHITQLFDSGFAEIASNFGEDGARRVAEGLGAAIDAIERLVVDCNIACDFERLPAYLYAPDEKGNKDVDDELSAMQKAGLAAEACAKLPLPYPTGKGLVLPKQAQFDPVAYLAGLAREIKGKGGVVCTGLRYKGVQEDKEHVTVQTEKGEIKAEHVILATHTPPNKFTLQLKLTPQRTYAIAVRCDKAFPKGLFYDTNEPYHYLRPHPYKGGEVVIVGGKDHRAGEFEDTDERYQALEAYARERLGVQEVVARWSGIVYEPIDGLPFIGTNPGQSRTWVITGLSGDGMTAGTLGAMICSELVQGKRSPWAELFTPSRIKPVAQAAAFAQHNVDVSRHLVADRVRAWLNNTELKKGEGAVMRQEGHVAAAYNDGKKVHLLSPVCPHAGCYVKFNGAEKTWDCPCHGSRFAATGKLLSGPAVSDLSPIE